MNDTDAALAMFREGFNCAQSVLAPGAAALGLEREAALRVAAAFGGGLARRGELCGALSGALMLAGLRLGATASADPAGKQATYAASQRILEVFREEHGSLLRRDLLGCDVSTPDGLQRVRDEDLHEKRCTRFVADAIRITYEELGMAERVEPRAP